MKTGFLLLAALASGFAWGSPSDYPALLEAVKTFEGNFSDQAALNRIYEAAKADDHEAVVTRCMGLYTLVMGATGKAATCQGGLQAITSRYPQSEVAVALGNLGLFPSPCEACQGTGVISQQKPVSCETCKNTGICTKCDGHGEYRYCSFHKCRKIWTLTEIEKLPHPPSHPDYSQWCYACYPKSNGGRAFKAQPTALSVRKCVDCSGTGKCPQCRGQTGSVTSNQKCPSCQGIPKGVNATVAQTALVKLCQETREFLQKAVSCEEAFAAALKEESPERRLAALNACLAQYEGALTLPKVLEARDALTQNVAQLDQQREEQARLRTVQAEEQAAQRQQLADQHRELLSVIRSTPSKTAALIEIRNFLSENPQTPVLVEARLLTAEIEQALAAEANAKVRNRYVVIGCGSVIGLAFLAWIVSCIKIARPKEIVIAQQAPPRDNTPRKIPSHAAAQRAQQLPVLQPKRLTTPPEWEAACPECGALLECPEDICEMDVFCSVCRKPFHVN